MDYLKLFQNHSEYEDFVSGGTMEKPNVSHCVSENGVHYNASVPSTIFRRVVTASQLTREVMCDSEGKLATIFDNGIEYFYREIGEDGWVIAFRNSSTSQFVSACGGQTHIDYSYDETNDTETLTLDGYSVVFKYDEELDSRKLIKGEIREWVGI